jgi:hypothetical protein
MKVIDAGQKIDAVRLRTPMGDTVAAVRCCHLLPRLTIKCQAGAC